MTVNFVRFYLACAILLAGCRKHEKAISFSGQILLSKKFPLPFVHQKVKIDQPGSPGIPAPIFASGSSTLGFTDGEGKFSVSFKPGTAVFIIFSSQNRSPLTFTAGAGDTSLFNFRYNNFGLTDSSAHKPIYASKIIDTAIVKVSLVTDLMPTDSIGVQLRTLQSLADKTYTGLRGNAGSTIVLDTIFNVALQEYDGLSKKFRNNLYAGRKTFLADFGRPFITSVGFPQPIDFSSEDEQKATFLFYFQ